MMKYGILTVLFACLLLFAACEAADRPDEAPATPDVDDQQPDEGAAEEGPFEVPEEDGYDVEFDASEYDI